MGPGAILITRASAEPSREPPRDGLSQIEAWRLNWADPRRGGGGYLRVRFPHATYALVEHLGSPLRVPLGSIRASFRSLGRPLGALHRTLGLCVFL